MNIFGFFIDWPNYRRSLAEGFSLAELLSSAAIEQDLRAELTHAYPNGTCYVWGTGAESSINQSTWDRMDKDDLVLGYNPWDKPRCAGRLVAKTKSPEIAELVWGDADFGLIFFLREFTELGPDRSETIYDYVGHVRGFRRVGDNNLSKIRQEFGDIEGFAKMVLQEPSRMKILPWIHPAHGSSLRKR